MFNRFDQIHIYIYTEAIHPIQYNITGLSNLDSICSICCSNSNRTRELSGIAKFLPTSSWPVVSLLAVTRCTGHTLSFS